MAHQVGEMEKVEPVLVYLIAVGVDAYCWVVVREFLSGWSACGYDL